MEDKNFTTFEYQIRILKNRGMLFMSEENAINALRRFGYYNIINGYKDQYVEMVNGMERYVSGVSFEQIFSLYCLDRHIRNSVLSSMLEIEDSLRNALAHTVAESFTANQEGYLDKHNYRSGKKRASGRYQLDEILTKFEKIANDDIPPIKHARDTYGNVPPWILFKGASFGNLVNFTKLLRPKEKNRVISMMYDLPIGVVQQYPATKELFLDTLFVCLDYRNTAAHGGRMYNLATKSTIRFNPILHGTIGISEADYRIGKGHNDIFTLSKALLFFDNKNPAYTLAAGIEFCVEKHCENFPADKSFLDLLRAKV